jgi:hypothetical protein
LLELEAAMPEGWHVPRPDLDPAFAWVWRAWWRLNRDRPWLGGGMGPMSPGRIPWQSVMDWADRHGQDAEFLDACVVGMDDTYLEFHAAQQKGKK